MLRKLFFLIVITTCILYVSLSCKKDTPPKAIVTVVDTGGIRMPNIKVTVYAKPNGSYINPDDKTINAIEHTDNGGDAYFTFKNKAIFYAKAEEFVGNNPVPVRSGEHILKIDINHTETVTVKIK